MDVFPSIMEEWSDIYIHRRISEYKELFCPTQMQLDASPKFKLKTDPEM
jgi:hypothetical protein